MSKRMKAAPIALLMITASAIFMWDSNAIASKLAKASEKPTPTQVQVTGFINYHVHLSRSFSVAQAAKLSKASGIKFGIVEHPYRITDDRALDQYIKMLEPYPVYKGLQPLYTNWAKDFSKEMLDKLDYVLMDAMTMPNKDGTWTRIGRPNTVVKDPQDFMKRYVDFSLYIINNEPIDIFGWPTVLPKCIADQYDQLWTNDRMQKIITAARNKKIAIEINEKAKVPSARFIKMAKSAGAKFTFGSDSSGPNSARLDYCLKMVELCRLTDKDMFRLESRAKAGAKAAETPTSTTVQAAGNATQDRLRQLLLERKQLLDKIAEIAKMSVEAGRRNAAEYAQAEQAALLAGIDLCNNKSERIEIHSEIVKLYRDLERSTERLVEMGDSTQVQVDKVRAIRLESEIGLLKEQLRD